MSTRYKKSEEFLARALSCIPLGSQTFSKSHVQFPIGVSPLFLQRGHGARVWDMDNNEYIDFVNSLLAVSLGYGDADVTKAVQEQLTHGVSFSLAHPLETLLAEKIIEMVPCAEMVRFGKNGSDATAGAIRLARAYTGKERVAVCGYHGWQDWYIGSTSRHLGVPKSTQALTHRFTFNSLESLRSLLDQYKGEFAAVILEPMNVEYPKPGFLEGVKKLTHEQGAVLIFDEMITGFRFAAGGAQAHFNVVPDLVTLGKGMANGYPLSVIAGRKDIMRLMEEIFFSFTFGGETISLAAALATLTKIQREPVIETLAALGTQLLQGVGELIAIHKMSNILSVAGHPAWSFLLFRDVAPYTQWDIKTFWMQEILERGILSFSTHNISYAHTPADIERLLSVYNDVFPLLRTAIENATLIEQLRCRPIQPVFKVR